MESWTWRVFPVKLYKNSFLWKYFYSPCIQPFLMKYLDESREWLKKKKSRVMIAEKDNHDFGTMGEKNKTSVSGRHWGGALIIFVLHNCSWNCSPFLEEKASCAAFQASGNILIQTNHGAVARRQHGGPQLLCFSSKTHSWGGWTAVTAKQNWNCLLAVPLKRTTPLNFSNGSGSPRAGDPTGTLLAWGLLCALLGVH